MTKVIATVTVSLVALCLLLGASWSPASVASENSMPSKIHSDAEPKPDEARKDESASAASPPVASSLPALSFASPPPQQPLKLPLVNPKIVIAKAARQLSLYSDGRVVRTYKIALGTNPSDDKIRQGDRATPEGDFYVCVKNARSNFYLSLGLSYPNLEDAERGLRDKLITRAQHGAIVRAIKNRRRPPWDTALGGEIFIHGGGTDGDWTWGCVALANPDIKELFDAVPMGTSVRIEG